MRREGILTVVSGFSGAGKGTLMRRLISRYDDYALSVSMTTRPPREGEREGVDYFFTDQGTFLETAKRGGLIEYAIYCDHYYGTPKAYVEEKLRDGKDVLLEIEMQGAMKVKKAYPEALLVFVMPPDAKELMRRLQGRGTETEVDMRKRLRRAAQEAKEMEFYDALLVNDDLDVCACQLHSVIQAAHCLMSRNLDRAARIRAELADLAKGED